MWVTQTIKMALTIAMADTIKRLYVSRPKSVTSRDTEGPVS